MSLRYVSIVFVATMLAMVAVLAASAAQPRKAEAEATVPMCTGGTITLTDAEKRSLDLHNQTRVREGLSKFCVHPDLQQAARAHSREMIGRDYFTHNSFNGESFSDRLKRYGYTPLPNRYWTVGENIAWGSGSSGSADSIFKGWMNSSGHKANILNGKFKQIGVGAFNGTYVDKATGRTHTNATMWTADFGTR